MSGEKIIHRLRRLSQIIMRSKHKKAYRQITQIVIPISDFYELFFINPGNLRNLWMILVDELI